MKKIQKKKKILILVIDGLADERNLEFKNKTPLEVAKTPNLDFLTKEGISGSIIPWVEKGKLPTSEDCHLAIFGYDPKKSNPGRGVLEALGIDFKLKKEDIAFRGNFATVNENFKIIDRRAGRIEKTESLISALNKIKIKGAKVIVRKSFGHRIVIVLRGKNLSEKVSSNDPKKVGVKVLKIRAQNKKAKKTVKVLEEFLEKARTILVNHPLNKKRIKKGFLPANYILLRGAGKLKKIENFKEKYGLKAAFVAGGILYKGIGKYLGMKEIKVKGATGMKNTNLKGKISAVKNALKKFDFVFLHIKAADTFAEDGNFLGKKKFLEKIDQSLTPLLKLKEVLIVITGDHPTSCVKKSHFFEKNPILIYGNGKDKVSKFSEKDCKKGKLGIFPQLELMKKVFTIDKKFFKK
jgi:2,3-bisphosphoglycerate-independent phosphoglycerate mutase